VLVDVEPSMRDMTEERLVLFNR